MHAIQPNWLLVVILDKLFLVILPVILSDHHSIIFLPVNHVTTHVDIAHELPMAQKYLFYKTQIEKVYWKP